MTDENDSKPTTVTQRIHFEWKWNITTEVVVLGFTSGAIAWGMTWQKVLSNQVVTDKNVAALELRTTALEANRIEGVERAVRLSTLERRVDDQASEGVRAQNVVTTLISDVKLIAEILSRVEKRVNEINK